MDFQALPITTQGEAFRLLRLAQKNINACGDSTVAVGYWVESHTIGCRDEAGDIDRWAAHWEFWEKYSNDGVSVLIGDPADGAFVSITPQKNRKATMGAEMLIELGRVKRKAGYINLELLSPEEDGTDAWVLRVERIDLYGGDNWKQDFMFQEEESARGWFNGIVGDEDLDALIALASR